MTMKIPLTLLQSCSVMLALGAFTCANAQSGAVHEAAPVLVPPAPEALQLTLLIRQMVLDQYDSEGQGELSDQDKAALVKDARSARIEARKKFLATFDKDGDGKLSPEEYKAFREHMERSRHGRVDHGRGGASTPVSHPPKQMVAIITPGKKHFMVAPGLFLLTKGMLLKKYDANGNGRIDPEEHALIMKDARALYDAEMQRMLDCYDLDQDGSLSPVEREQALVASYQDSPLYDMDDPDDIDLFIKANISEILLNEPGGKARETK